MKRINKLLSLILTVFIAMSMLSGFAPADTPTETTGGEVFELPDIVDSEEAKANDYVGRVKSEEKDLYSFVFANGDGTNTMRIYSHPVKYVAKDGSVRDIALDIEAKANGGFVTADHEVITTFEKKLTDGISLEYNDVKVMLVPKHVLGTEATAILSSDGKTVTYGTNDVTSFVYELTYAGFKEDIVVEEYTGQTEYEFTLLTNGLTLCEEYGSYYLADAEGNVKATIGDIIVFTADERNNTMGSMSYETVRANQEYVLTIHLDADYLADEKTAYPIRIDPTIEVTYANSGAGAIEDVTINQNSTFSGAYNSLYVGRHPAGSLSRSLMRFPNLSLSGISANQITSATVELRDLMCQGDEDITVECHIYNKSAPAWSESGTTTWASVGTAYLGSLLDSHVISYGKGNVGNHRYSFNILTAAKAWANGTQSPAKGLVFKANSAFENQTGSAVKNWYKTFSAYNRTGEYCPSLKISYKIPDGSSFAEAEAISLNTLYSVNIDTSNKLKYFKFVPSATGFYTFESSSIVSGDPKAWLYNSSQNQLHYNDDDAGNRNFRLTYHLVFGRQYYFAAGCYGSGIGEYKVKLTFIQAYNEALIPTDVYYIKNIGSAKYIDIDGPGAQEWIHQWDIHAGAQARWILQKQTDGYYTIRSEYGYKYYIGVTNTTSEVNNIKLYSGVSDATKWKIYKNSAGELLFEPKKAPGKVLYAPNNSTGTKLQLVLVNSIGDNIKWKQYIYKGTLSIWNADGTSVGYWDKVSLGDSINIYRKKLNSNGAFYFLNGVNEATDQWKNALGVTLVSTTTESSGNIKIYGGTEDELIREGYISTGTTWAGLTRWSFYRDRAICSVGDKAYYIGETVKADIYIKSGYTSSETRMIIAHELGHALGYYGHSPTSADVMYAYVHSSYTLKSNEKSFLKQVYDLFR